MRKSLFSLPVWDILSILTGTREYPAKARAGGLVFAFFPAQWLHGPNVGAQPCGVPVATIPLPLPTTKRD